MAGRLFNIVGKQSFVMNFGGTGLPSVILGNRYYDVRSAVTGVLLVRLFSMAGLPGSASLQVTMNNLLQMPDDPGSLYVGSSVASVTLGTNTTSPILNSTGFSSTGVGQMVYFTLSTTTEIAATVTAVLAVDLLIRDT